MMNDAAQQALLDLAVARGLISAADVPAPDASTLSDVDALVLRWGPRLAALVRRGLLAEPTLCSLAKLPSAQPDPPAGGDVSPPAAPEPLKDWDRYEFLGLLGQGGMGVVFRARDRRLGRIVAIKFLQGTDPAQARRFLTEARAQARIDHPHVCQVYEVGEVAGKPYIAMQLIDGEPLDLAQGRLSLPQKVQLVRDAAFAIHQAHLLGIIHRDIKPGNIMVAEGKDGAIHPVVMDFGLAREIGAPDALTRSGAVLGTPSYMSPEQARGDVRHMDRRSDVYSLGATLYELLSGRAPFSADNMVDVLLQVLSADAPSVRTLDPSLPVDLATIVMKCLEKDPGQRYESARALAEDLQRYIEGEPILGRRTSIRYRARRLVRRHRALVVLGALSVLCLGIVGAAGLRAQRQRARAEKEAELGQRLGLDIKDMEWLMRAAYLLPLHDVRPEQTLVRARMEALEQKLRGFGELSRGLSHYALGRGYLALHDYERALEQLKQAPRDARRAREGDYALGRVLAERYRRALDEARLQGGAASLARRQKELEAGLLMPALEALKKSLGAVQEAPSYVEGLLAFYQGRFPEALSQAQQAKRGMPWFYEARKLEGDVHLEQAVRAADHGRGEEALREYALAVSSYEQAAEVGRSDAEIYDGIADAWVRSMRIDLRRGRFPPGEALAKALAACDRSAAAAPWRAEPYLKRANAYSVALVQPALQRSERLEEARAGIEKMFAAIEQAVRMEPEQPHGYFVLGKAEKLAADLSEVAPDPAAAERHIQRAIAALDKFVQADGGSAIGLIGLAHVKENLADMHMNQGRDPRPELDEVIALLRRAVAADPDSFTGYERLGSVYTSEVMYAVDHGEEPSALVRAAEDLYQTCMRKNPENQHCYVQFMLQGVLALRYACLARAPGGAVFHERMARMAEDIRARFHDDVTPTYYHVVGWGHSLRGDYELGQHRDPGPWLAQADTVIQKCLTRVPRDPTCSELAGDVGLTRAEWLVAQKRPGEAERILLSVLADAQSAVAQQPADLSAHTTLAKVYLRVAEARLLQGLPARRDLEAGLSAARAGMAKNRRHAAMLSFQGALQTVAARQERSATARKALASAAVASLNEALELNPLMRHDFGDYLTEATALGGAR